MAVTPEDFYEEEVESIVHSGNKLLGANFRLWVEDCPALSQMVVTCNPALPGRHLIETIPGPNGVEVPEPGPLKTGGQFSLTFQDTFTGKAFEEVTQWAMDSINVDKRKTVRVYGTHELGESSLDITYTHCFPEMGDGEFDYANKTAPAKFSLTLHFAMRKWTKAR